MSRFTVINWARRGKIKAFRTPGGHYRIPISEVVSFLEPMDRGEDKEPVARGLLRHCWQLAEKAGLHEKCSECVIYKREIDSCFALVNQFGKEAIGCEGNCWSCGFFAGFFGKSKGMGGESGEELDIRKEMDAAKEGLLCRLSYDIGRHICGVKDKIRSLL